MLGGGQVGGIQSLAARYDVNRAYIGRILRLALLAADIVEAIVKGKEPSGLSLRELAKNLPAHWDQQHLVVGF